MALQAETLVEEWFNRNKDLFDGIGIDFKSIKNKNRHKNYAGGYY